MIIKGQMVLCNWPIRHQLEATRKSKATEEVNNDVMLSVLIYFYSLW